MVRTVDASSAPLTDVPRCPTSALSGSTAGSQLGANWTLNGTETAFNAFERTRVDLRKLYFR